jgi:hypothetical protein
MSRQAFRNLENLERQFLSGIRNKIHSAEDRIDLENCFSHSMASFLNEAMSDEILVGDEDILFSHRSSTYYTLSPRLKGSKSFMDLWRNSNLPNFVGKVASSAYHQYQHLGKHPEKTERKIRSQKVSPWN